MAKLKIYSVKTKEFGRRFWSYMNIVVKGEESKGKQRKSVNVKFRKEINTYNLKRGIIDGEFDAPFIWEIKEETKDGKTKKVYPTIWVRKLENYTEQLAKHPQSDFILDDEKDEDEEETTF